MAVVLAALIMARCLDPDDATAANRRLLASGEPCLRESAKPANRPLTEKAKALILRAADDVLLDAPSARWRWPKSVIDNNVAYCGLVNAKNRMGAYTGWTPFLAIFLDDDRVSFILAGSGKDYMIDGACSK